MQYTLTPPTSLHADINLPASKSISNRALILHAFSHGTICPTHLSDCDDTLVMIRALNHESSTVDILAAGTAMRFLTAYFSVTPGTRILTGTTRMQQRPIRILVDALRQLGADIAYEQADGYPPLRITGHELQGTTVSLAGNVSSQYISALLMLGAVLPQGLTLQLTGEIISRPYIDLTLQLMRDFGAQADWQDNHTLLVQAGGYHDTPFCVESDWSAASYWYQMVALHANTDCEVKLQGLQANSYQGDSRGAALFAKLGVQTQYTANGITLTRNGKPSTQLNEDLSDIPDLAQTFVVTCCLKGIPFHFTGLQTLRIKETDRIAALITELGKLGYQLHAEQDNALYWNGERCQADNQPLINTYEDHRMAMAFAPACLTLGSIRIHQPQVVSKSYPHYWDDLQQAGFYIQASAQ